MKKLSAKILLLLTTFLTLPPFAGESEDKVVLEPKVAKYSYSSIPKDPLASAFFSATIPGSGQIYNKEYLRGIITGAGFYASLLTVYYMADKYDKLNTETFYVEGVDINGIKTGKYYPATAPVSKDDEVGFSETSEKIIAGVSLLSTAGFWVWGIIDSYRGANRYNNKLFAKKRLELNIDFASLTKDKSLKLTANYSF